MQSGEKECVSKAQKAAGTSAGAGSVGLGGMIAILTENLGVAFLVAIVVGIIVYIYSYPKYLERMIKENSCPNCGTVMDFTDTVISEEYAGQHISQKQGTKGEMVRVFKETHERVNVCPKCGYKEPHIYSVETERY